MSEFLSADTIVLVKADNLHRKYENLIVQNPEKYFRGNVADRIVIPTKFGPSFLKAEYYLLFLKKNGDCYSPVHMTKYFIGLSSLDGMTSCHINSPLDFYELLKNCLVRETNPDCALLQSDFFNDAPDGLKKGVWNKLASLKTASSGLQLAHLNIGIRAVGAEALKTVREPIRLSFRELPGGTRTYEYYYGTDILDSIRAWIYKNASKENCAELLDFAATQEGEFRGEILTAVSEYCSTNNAPAVVSLLKSDSNTMVQYGCLQCLKYIFNKGSGIPTTEIFKNDKNKYLQECVDLLKSRGFDIGPVGISEKPAAK